MDKRRHAGRMALALAVFALGAVPTSAAAVEPIIGVPVPDEQLGDVLADGATSAVPFDLDDDGVLELVAVRGASDAAGLTAIQAWWVADDGSAVGSDAIRLRRSASVDELLGGRGRLGIDRDDMIQVRIGDAHQLVVAQRDGRDVLLVATLGTNPQDGVAPCCLTIWEVVQAAPGEIDLQLVADTQRLGVQLIAADMDADGTDEIIVTEGPLNDEASDILEIGLLTWTGDRFTRTEVTIGFVPSCCATLLDAGETDGVPGDDVLLTGPGPNVSVGLHRITLAPSGPVVERADIVEVGTARIVDLEAGPAILTGDGFATMFLWSWPRGVQAERLAFRTTGGYPLAIFGRGDDTRLIIGQPYPGSVLVLPGDLGLGAGPRSTFGRDTRAGSFADAVQGDEDGTLLPFYGVVPGGLPAGQDAFLFAGGKVHPTTSASDPVSVEVDPVAILPGVEPLGAVGPGAQWMAVLSGFNAFRVPFATAPAVKDLLFAPRDPGRLQLVAVASILEPEQNLGDLVPTFYGVAPDPAHPSAFVVGNEAADAEVVAPAGTEVSWSTRSASGHRTIGHDGVVRIRLLEPAGPNAPDGSGATARIWLVTPAGHGYAGTWRIRVYRQPPDLGISEDPALVELNPTLSGRTAPGSTVTVNGGPVAVAPDGSFEVPVDVGFLPTELRVVVTDPVGNRTERVVTRVWPVDYRQLPFVPMVVLVTVAAALFLFLRKPDPGPRRRTPDDGSTFEEIGG